MRIFRGKEHLIREDIDEDFQKISLEVIR